MVLSQSFLRSILLALLLIVAVIFLIKSSPTLLSPKILAADDFVEYWAAGRLNFTGQNPYDPAALSSLQLAAGRRQGVPVVMWNPPWTLSLVMPFGALPYPLSRILWFLGHIALILFCASALWRFYQGSPAHLWVAWMISLTFFPTLLSLKVGQIPPLILLGAVLFLIWTERQRWWLLSISIMLITIKPHTLYLVTVTFLVWTITARRWPLLFYAALGLIAALCLPLAINPLLLKQYLHAVSQFPPCDWATPTLGGALRLFLSCSQVWLQFLPTVLGLIWFVCSWQKERLTWNWAEQMPLLVTVSVLTASYGWAFDYVVLLLPVLSLAPLLLNSRLNRITLLSLLLYGAVQAIAFSIPVVSGRYNYFWDLWLAPALAGWYFLTRRLVARRYPQFTNLRISLL